MDQDFKIDNLLNEDFDDKIYNEIDIGDIEDILDDGQEKKQ
jgi:hypothetical protein